MNLQTQLKYKYQRYSHEDQDVIPLSQIPVKKNPTNVIREIDVVTEEVDPSGSLPKKLTTHEQKTYPPYTSQLDNFYCASKETFSQRKENVEENRNDVEYQKLVRISN